jgi:hypothetical protein
MNILLYNLKLKIQKFLLNLIMNKIFGVRFVGVRLKYNTLNVLIFSIFFVAKIYDLIFIRPFLN